MKQKLWIKKAREYYITFYFLNEKEVFRLGKQLLKLNISAVMDRYSNDKSDFFKSKERLKDFKPSIDEICTDFQVLKSIQCFLYQCSEGNIPKRKLYKEIEEVQYKIMSGLIDKTAEYKKAEWG